MFKFIVFAAVLATATCKPSGILAPAAPLAAAPLPLPYAAPFAPAPAIAYAAAPAAPVAYAAAPAVAVPPPVAYATGHEVSYAVEPVEQHGYSIAY